MPAKATTQTVTVVGSPHFAALSPAVDSQHVRGAVEVLSAFEPSRVCIEAMDGALIETLLADPERYGALLRRFAGSAPAVGARQQLVWEVSPADAREMAGSLARRGSELDGDDRARLIGLQLAGYEFASAVLNWSYLQVEERVAAGTVLGDETVATLERAERSRNEIYALALPLARDRGLFELCAVDSFVDEQSVQLMIDDLGPIIAHEGLQARVEELNRALDTAWAPARDGDRALLATLAYFNGPEYAELDRRSQWDVLEEFDDDSRAGRRRLMYWHARTSTIAAGLFRALAGGPDERVLLVIGGAHRPFLEALLESQPWLTVVPASTLLEGPS